MEMKYGKSYRVSVKQGHFFADLSNGVFLRLWGQGRIVLL